MKSARVGWADGLRPGSVEVPGNGSDGVDVALATRRHLHGALMHSPLVMAAAVGADIPVWLIAPFALLMLLIATMPLTPPRVKHLWEHYYPHISVALGAPWG